MAVIYTNKNDGKIVIECSDNSLFQKLFLLKTISEDILEHLEKIEELEDITDADERDVFFEFNFKAEDILSAISRLINEMERLPESIKASWYDEKEKSDV